MPAGFEALETILLVLIEIEVGQQMDRQKHGKSQGNLFTTLNPKP